MREDSVVGLDGGDFGYFVCLMKSGGVDIGYIDVFDFVVFVVLDIS